MIYITTRLRLVGQRLYVCAQADRLLRLVGVPNHLDGVLRPYVERWIAHPDHGASAHAYTFAYR